MDRKDLENKAGFPEPEEVKKPEPKEETPKKTPPIGGGAGLGYED